MHPTKNFEKEIFRQVSVVYIVSKLPFKFYVNNNSKKNIRQLNTHRCYQPLFQLSSAVSDVTSPVKLVGNLAPRFPSWGRKEGERTLEEGLACRESSRELVLSRSVPSLLTP